MSVLSEWLVGIAAAMLPSESRSRYAEQWSADLRDADEVGVRRFQIVFGAFRLAAETVHREVWSRELKATFGWIQPAILLLLLAVPLYFAAVRDDIFTSSGEVGSPLPEA